MCNLMGFTLTFIFDGDVSSFCHSLLQFDELQTELHEQSKAQSALEKLQVWFVLFCFTFFCFVLLLFV